jgi:hypothetical protein
MSTYNERKKQLLRETLLEMNSLLTNYNKTVNYFDKDVENVYSTLLLAGAVNCRLQDVRNFDRYSFLHLCVDTLDVEEVKENVCAFMTDFLRPHSELTYFLNELKRYNKRR